MQKLLRIWNANGEYVGVEKVEIIGQARDTVLSVAYEGRVYLRTGKVGTRHNSGESVQEMANGGARAWISRGEINDLWLD